MRWYGLLVLRVLLMMRCLVSDVARESLVEWVVSWLEVLMQYTLRLTLLLTTSLRFLGYRAHTLLVHKFTEVCESRSAGYFHYGRPWAGTQQCVLISRVSLFRGRIIHSESSYPDSNFPSFYGGLNYLSGVSRYYYYYVSHFSCGLLLQLSRAACFNPPLPKYFTQWSWNLTSRSDGSVFSIQWWLSILHSYLMTPCSKSKYNRVLGKSKMKVNSTHMVLSNKVYYVAGVWECAFHV